MKHVFSMEMERESDLQTLAETIVMCQLKKRGGMCRKSECSECATQHDLERCMDALPACDKLRVKNMAQDLYGVKKFQYGMDEPRGKEKLREWGEAAVALGVTLVEGLLVSAAIIAPTYLYVLRTAGIL